MINWIWAVVYTLCLLAGLAVFFWLMAVHTYVWAGLCFAGITYSIASYIKEALDL